MNRICLLACLAAAPALADPAVVADIPVTRGLAEAVIGQEEVESLLESGADPHHAALRPSQMSAIESADLVVTVGGGLFPALERALPGDRTLALAGETGEGGEPGHAGHDHAAGHEGHEAGHSGSADDPHLWLDPDIAADWLDRIAERLSKIDPDGNATYRANAEAARGEIEAAAAAARERIDAAGPAKFLAAHDAWSHAEAALGLDVVASISDSHAVAPGARELSDLDELVAGGGVDCLLVVPGEETAQVVRIAETHGLPVVEAAALGGGEAPGLGRYLSVIDGIAGAVESCAGR